MLARVKNFRDICFYALAENKKGILKSSVRPIEHLTIKRIGIISGKYAFIFHCWYMADTIHERSRTIKPKYIAWLDEKKNALRFVKIKEQGAVNTKDETVEFDGTIFETR
jgi:hypothetical protein